MKLKSILSALLLMPGTVAGQESAPLAGRASFANLLIKNQEPRTYNQEPKTKNQKPRTYNLLIH